MKKILLLTLIALVLFVSCKDEVTPPDPSEVATIVFKDLDGKVVATKTYTEDKFSEMEKSWLFTFSCGIDL